MFFRFDHLLSPTFVYGAMLRLKQVDWLDRFNAILCTDEDLMWELRKKLPGFQGKIDNIWQWDYENLAEYGFQHPILVVVTKYHGYDVDFEIDDDDFVVDQFDLWPVSTPTANYA